ncbi:MAG: methylmalonyl-CoA mutase, partial [Chlorobi bacterium]|nr:methylmalonyl-CoA mutase [Chlorobiota bacterium]
MKEVYKAKDPRTWWLRFHTQTAGCTLTAQQPENNIVRTALQALAGVLGGTQSLHTNSMDETLALPSEKAVKIALRTQQIIAYETGVINTVDPLGGSYYVEALTNQMEEEVNKIFDEIDNFGGVIPAIETGYFQKEIARSAYRYQLELEKKEKFIVGVNEFVDEESKIDIPILHISKEVEVKQKARLKELKKKRDQKKVDESLEKISYAAAHDGNLMRIFVEAAENYVTLGEMVNELKKHFGIYEETAQF